MRDWLLVLGGLLIVGVLAHGAWIAWRSRRSELRMGYERNIPDLDMDDIDLLRAELPSGGARVVRPAPQSEGEGPVPVLMDPIDQDLQPPEPDPEPPPVDSPADKGPPRSQREASAAPPVVDADADAEPEPLPPTDTGSEPEQAPLFAGEPIVARERAGRRVAASRRAEPRKSEPRKAEPRKAEPRAVQREAEAEPEDADIEDVLVINVLRRGTALMPGSDLLEVVSDHGLRYGDMNIFHRYGAGQRIEFSMANAVKPGTFDLGAIDELRTPGVTFFLRLPGPDQPLEAFDDMARIARDMAERLDAELKDERHSVMTAQTLEHCRQRIREFRRRQMSRRS